MKMWQYGQMQHEFLTPNNSLTASKDADADFMRWLNQRGDEGWELIEHERFVSMPTPDGTVFVYECMFKRHYNNQ